MFVAVVAAWCAPVIGITCKSNKAGERALDVGQERVQDESVMRRDGQGAVVVMKVWLWWGGWPWVAAAGHRSADVVGVACAVIEGWN